MDFDLEFVNEMEKKDRLKVILLSGIPFYVIATIFEILGYILSSKNVILYKLLYFAGMMSSLYAIRPMFYKECKQIERVKSVYIIKNISDAFFAGDKSAIRNYRKIRFEHDSLYRNRIVKLTRKRRDSVHLAKVKQAESEVKRLNTLRANKISMIEKSRKGGFAPYFYYDLYTGIMVVDGVEQSIQKLHGAQINDAYSFRVEKYIESQHTENTTKKPSVAGGVIGLALGGVVGAAVGATRFASSSKKDEEHSQEKLYNIPTCIHLGVLIIFEDFRTEISLLSKEVDKDSIEYKIRMKKAHEITNRLYQLSANKDKKFLPAERNEEVLDLDAQIASAQEKLSKVNSLIPDYTIPEKYIH